MNAHLNLSEPLRRTIGDEAWLRKHADQVAAAFPETWTHLANIKMLAIAFRLKLAGIDWHSDDDFGAAMVLAERAGLLRRDGMLLRRGPLKTSGARARPA